MRTVLPRVVIVFLLLIPAGAAPADPGPKHPIIARSELPFLSGEKLTYTISWSNIVQAGTAVMEVNEEPASDGKTVYRFTSTAHSSGIVHKFYKVADRIDSVVDRETLSTLTFHLDQNHGTRKKKRDMTFNQKERTVTVRSEVKEATSPVPAGTKDALSALYYLRTVKDLADGKTITFDVHDDDKTWKVDVQVLGREKISTSLGETDTIKLRTYPKYDGVFQNKGEIYFWLTDDARRIPVLMKSVISIGSIVSTLVDLKPGEPKK
jgi:hypothetical protein